MGTLNQYFGGTRRFYYSGAPETTWGTAVTLDRVLNPIDGSETLGPPEVEPLDNANSAQGQGELPTKQYAGAQLSKASPMFHLTPEAAGRFLSSLFGTDTKTAFDTSGYQHAMTWSRAPKSFTVEEHCLGAADGTNLAWKFSGAVVTGLKITQKAGTQFCTIQPRLFLGAYAAAADQSALDVIANWPGAGTLPGMPPTQVGLWAAPTTGNNHTSAFDGTISTPATAGTLFEDLGSEINFNPLADGWELDLDWGGKESDRFRAGSGTGFVAGQVYSEVRKATLTVDLNATSDTNAMLTWFKDYTTALQKSWTFQITGVSDYICGATKPSGLSIVINAMRPVFAKDSTNIGPVTRKLTFQMMQAASSDELIEAWTWDKINQDYA